MLKFALSVREDEHVDLAECLPACAASPQAKSVQPLFNAMVDAVARDEQYLEDTLEAAAK